jgi:uncharacterized repeat protein (TIGR01451 family)
VKRFQPLVFSVALLLLAACGQDTQPEAAAPGFSFSIDPAAESVNLTSADAQALKTLQIGECGSGSPRVLFPEEELALTSYDAVFLPGNMLEITAEFTNVTNFTFEQPFTFTRADSTRNIVSSQEPEVTDADLGGDGMLSPSETTSTLTFTVEHRGQPFTYEVFAEAVVNCGDGSTDPGTPGDPTLANLGVVKTGPAEVVLDANGDATLDYSVTVTNNGGALAEGVELTDTFFIDLSAFAGGVTADLSATLLPDGCILQADAAVEDNLVAVCTLGALASGGSTTLDFTFGVDLLGDLTLIDGPIAVSNTADAITTTAENVLDDNIAVVDTVLTTAPVAALADLAVTKTGDTAVTFDETGAATLNYSVAVTNNGSALAEGVELTDTLTIDLSAFPGITADLTATVLPTGCAIDTTVLDAEVVVCTVGSLDAGATTNLDFTFAVDLAGDLTTITGPIPVTNTADATTLTEEADLTNNSALVDTALTAAPVANLAVAKTGDTTVTTDANGDATLNYSVVVTNNGEAIAEGTELTDTFIIDLSASGGLGEVTATVLPTGCIIDAAASVGGTEIAICTLGALASGGSSTLDFSFAVDLPADVAPGSSLPVTNTADATTTTSESDLTDNSAVVNSTVTVL